jgi:hypothetical protein
MYTIINLKNELNGRGHMGDLIVDMKIILK